MLRLNFLSGVMFKSLIGNNVADNLRLFRSGDEKENISRAIEREQRKSDSVRLKFRNVIFSHPSIFDVQSFRAGKERCCVPVISKTQEHHVKFWLVDPHGAEA